MKILIKLSPLLILPGFISTAFAASFDCTKASTFVEKTICGDQKLSDLDDLLGEHYKGDVKRQRAWLKERDKCATSACILEAYTERLTELDVEPVKLDTPEKRSEGTPAKIVMGRCHMLGCWWWGIDSIETIKSEDRGKLLKLGVRTTTAYFSDIYYTLKGYPELPPTGAMWGEESVQYVFCSKALPAVMAPAQKSPQLEVTFPWDPAGNASGASEGTANLYRELCGITTSWDLPGPTRDPKLTVPLLDDPSDLFNYVP